MKETVLITGVDGYIGYPLALSMIRDGYRVIGIDNFIRRQNVKSMGSTSAIPIEKPTERTNLLKSLGNYSFYNQSTLSQFNVDSLFKSHKIDVIINLAQQPSAPFSHQSQFQTNSTTNNNICGVVNLLYAMKNFAPDAHLIHIGTMGEYDPACNVSIPEGFFKFWYKFRKSTESFFPRRPGSFYHASKVATTYYIDLACRSWGLRATDIMQGIVFGNWTPETEKHQSHTRLDCDEAFGTVLNRFVVQTVLGTPLTIYGNGFHKRGFLSLYDSISCLQLAVKHPPLKSEYRTWNQFFLTLDMNTVARNVMNVGRNMGFDPVSINIPTPRTETTDKHYYNPETKVLKSLGFIPDCSNIRHVREEIEYMFLILQSNPPFHLTTVVQEPKITWRKT